MARLKWQREAESSIETLKKAKQRLHAESAKRVTRLQELQEECDRNLAKLVFETKLLEKLAFDLGEHYIMGSFSLRAAEDEQKSKGAKAAFKQLRWLLKKSGDVVFSVPAGNRAAVLRDFTHKGCGYMDLRFSNIKFYKSFRKKCKLSVKLSGYAKERRRKREELANLERIKEELLK